MIIEAIKRAVQVAFTSQQPAAKLAAETPQPKADRIHEEDDTMATSVKQKEQVHDTDTVNQKEQVHDTEKASDAAVASAPENQLRAALIEKEEVRWGEIDESQLSEQQKWERIRELGERNRRNTSSVPYDPITLGYHDNKDGDQLRHNDNMVRYRSAMRAQQLRSRNTCGFDPITGVPGNHLSRPEKPMFKPNPEHLN